MKIGILTFHYAYNYGAVLQAFALRKFLSSNFEKVEIVNYRNKHISNAYKDKLKVHISIIDCFHPKLLKKKISTKLDYKCAKKSWIELKTKFDSFARTYLYINSDLPCLLDDFKDNYDAFVAGSDQIWNYKITGGTDSVYYLNFDSRANKIFYAASNGRNYVPDEELPAFRAITDNFHFFSTREDGLSTFLNEMFNVDSIGVVDPSFLLTKKDYVNCFNLSKSGKRYVLVYYVFENHLLSEIAHVIANALGCEVLEIHYLKTRSLNNDNQRANVGPDEFLSYIFNAEFVLTNSFHGTAFSIIFEKQFYSYYKKDSRIDNLLTKLNLSNRHISSFADVDLNDSIDYQKIDLESFSHTSKNYLLNAIKNEKH